MKRSHSIFMGQLARLAHIFRIRTYLPFKYVVDVFLWTLATPIAFYIRVESDIFRYSTSLIYFTLIGFGLKTAIVLFFSLHRQSWHKIGVRDLYALIRAVSIGTLALLAIGFVTSPIIPVPRSIPLLDGVIALIMLGASRMILRVFNEWDLTRSADMLGQRILVIGAGDTGSLIVREMFRHPDAAFNPVGYLDDENSKQRETIAGKPVLGRIADLPEVVEQWKIDEVLIAMPSAPGDVIRQVVELARSCGVKHRIFPGVVDILRGQVAISQIRDVDVEDLLRRDPVRIDMQEIAEYIEGRTILVTGAGGSIGTEIVRQITRFNPGKIVLVDRDENNMYMFEREISGLFSGMSFVSALVDIQRKEKLRCIFSQHEPEVVFHAAAHKHVSIMESHPDEAVLNNIMGTRNMLDLAREFRVRRFVNISTDKAVMPTSIMGATKRVAEMLVEATSLETEEGQAFVSVRFGNVLGSRGSVIPIFKEQIRLGGPITVTHPEMTRFFMSIPEATQLVLQAASLGENGAVYILDMGSPIKILDIATELIRLSGFEPYIDIDIRFIGARPGERLHEELLTEDEGKDPTPYKQIYVLRKNISSRNGFDSHVQHLITAAQCSDTDRVRSLLQDLISTYHLTASL